MQGACVMNTLDSVVDALASDPARKFIVVEQVSIHSLVFDSYSPLVLMLVLCFGCYPLFFSLNL
jgi:hypothetical protein